MNVRIKPGKLSGVVNVPSSKSLSHRAIIAASLAKGKSVIKNITYSEDIKATIKAMEALGAKICCFSDYVVINGQTPKRIKNTIDCSESGSTLRFLIPIALTTNEPITFIGHGKLPKRPLDVYFDIFKEQNIDFEYKADYLPLTIKKGLKSQIFKVRGDISSQFITGLLFALPLLDGDSKIIVTTKLESKGYIDLTLDILKKFGIKIIYKNNEFIIEGNQEYKPYNYTVEGDYSQAAFFLVLNMLGNDVKLENMNLDSLQGDKKILEDIKSFGADIVYDKYLYAIKKDLHGASISFEQSPDLGPALTVLASVSEGKSHFYNAKRLRIKECDRITCMKEELDKLGADITEFLDGMDIVGKKLHGGTVSSHNDHRVVMALSLLCTVIGDDLVIENCEAVNKSFPNFFDVLKNLGGKISYE